MKFTNYLLFAVLFLPSCIDAYEPPAIQNPNSFLVVEGIISSPSTTIQLSRTRNLAQPDTIFEIGAQVFIENESQNTIIPLKEIGGGSYEEETNLVVGQNYRVKILTTNNVEYISEYTPLLQVPEIDSLNWKVKDSELEIYVTTQATNNTSRYYRWTYEETWEYAVRYSSAFDYDGNTVVDRTRSEQIYICWRTSASPEITVNNTVALSENIVNQSLVKTLNDANLLKVRRGYSILVKQYALTKEAFEFWELLKLNTESLGSFFDPQPSQLISNIRSVSNPNEPIVGYISASMATESRLFIPTEEVPKELIPPNPLICELDSFFLSTEEIISARDNKNLIPVEEIRSSGGEVIGYTAGTFGCTDCRVYGGTTEQPTFWQ